MLSNVFTFSLLFLLVVFLFPISKSLLRLSNVFYDFVSYSSVLHDVSIGKNNLWKGLMEDLPVQRKGQQENYISNYAELHTTVRYTYICVHACMRCFVLLSFSHLLKLLSHACLFMFVVFLTCSTAGALQCLRVRACLLSFISLFWIYSLFIYLDAKDVIARLLPLFCKIFALQTWPPLYVHPSFRFLSVFFFLCSLSVVEYLMFGGVS